MESGKFIQIATATASQSVMIYALDDQGNVWKCVEGGESTGSQAEPQGAVLGAHRDRIRAGVLIDDDCHAASDREVGDPAEGGRDDDADAAAQQNGITLDGEEYPDDHSVRHGAAAYRIRPRNGRQPHTEVGLAEYLK